MTDPAPPEMLPVMPPLDAHGRLAWSITCLGCGYELRGLNPAGTCPECGLAVEVSAGRGRLAFADARWLRVLATGLGWVWTAPLLVLPAVLALGCLIAPVLTAMDGDDFFWDLVSSGLIILLLALPPATVVVGIWKFTSPEPGGPPPGIPRAERARIAGRWLTVAAVALLYLAPWLLLLSELGIHMGGASAILAVAGAVAAILAIHSLRIWSLHLARRLPAPRLALATQAMGWLMEMEILVLLLSLPLVNAPYDLRVPPSWVSLAEATVSFSVAAGFLSSLVVLGLVRAYRLRLTEAGSSTHHRLWRRRAGLDPATLTQPSSVDAASPSPRAGAGDEHP